MAPVVAPGIATEPARGIETGPTPEVQDGVSPFARRFPGVARYWGPPTGQTQRERDAAWKREAAREREITDNFAAARGFLNCARESLASLPCPWRNHRVYESIVAIDKIIENLKAP